MNNSWIWGHLKTSVTYTKVKLDESHTHTAYSLSISIHIILGMSHTRLDSNSNSLMHTVFNPLHWIPWEVQETRGINTYSFKCKIAKLIWKEIGHLKGIVHPKMLSHATIYSTHILSKCHQASKSTQGPAVAQWFI